MRLTDQFSDAYENFGEEIFKTEFGIPLCLEEIILYCPDRVNEENKTSLFEVERTILRHLRSNVLNSSLYLVGESGCGKSTLLRYTLDFLLHYNDQIAMNGYSNWLEEAIESNKLPEPDSTNYCVIYVSIENSDTSTQSINDACRKIRSQLCSMYPNLMYEDDYACVTTYIYGTPTNLGDQEIRDRIKNAADSLVIDHDKAKDFCQAALVYLRRWRNPSSERKHLVLVVDDSDFVEAKHAVNVMSGLEKLASGVDDEATPLTFIHSLRPDTLELRDIYQPEQNRTIKVKIGRVDFVKVVENIADRFKASFLRVADDIDDEIVVEPGIVYYLPLPEQCVGELVEKIALSATAAFANEPESGRFANRQVITPLAGDSLRRIKRFQRRIAESTIIEHKSRSGERISNYDILRGLITGRDGLACGLEDQYGVGEWFRASDSKETRYISTPFVIQLLGCCSDGTKKLKRIIQHADMLGIREVDEVVERLSRLTYLGRKSDTGRVQFRSSTLNALFKLITHPAYIDISAIRLFDGAEYSDGGRRMTSPSDAKETFRLARKLIHEISDAEKIWLEGLVSRSGISSELKINIQKFFREFRIKSTALEIINSYSNRLNALLKDAESGDFSLVVEDSRNLLDRIKKSYTSILHKTKIFMN